ncbi:hypothetical protein CB0940_10037 [Cercospora beticola]|uniref:Uncharacterized protein n=1 Tax=Cercospora beticola TaxID=122368 RepID=A0A2G5HIF3_CERBT|nr:hypothetical protein CB0940_10037 [Cercospora beticola]PIA92318.1 hypothetical protein CB0940_10037 [Cercospora beticola]WPB05601.1 hypothetical protein RHO25_010254 [Cercospora beticola]CAK1365435.1 unnamed protein product [Cercospora beticola]
MPLRHPAPDLTLNSQFRCKATGYHNLDEMSASDAAQCHALRKSLLNLPQELHDRIYDLTFTTAPKIRIYKPGHGDLVRQVLAELHEKSPSNIVVFDERLPHLLHVSRASRELFAKSYFGGDGAVFVFYAPVKIWRVPIEKCHWELIKDARVAFTNSHYLVNWESRQFKNERAFNYPGKDVVDRIPIQWHHHIERLIKRRMEAAGLEQLRPSD